MRVIIILLIALASACSVVYITLDDKTTKAGIINSETSRHQTPLPPAQ